MVILPNLGPCIFSVRIIENLVIITSILMEVPSHPGVLISLLLGMLYFIKEGLLVLISWLDEKGICNSLAHQDH
jgi:hypothetical protein